MRRLFMFLIFMLVTLHGPSSVLSQEKGEEGDLVTDRPDFTESAVVVPQGRIQIESGLTWERGDDDVTMVTIPELLVRWAVAGRLELRFGLPNYIDMQNHTSHTGFGDSSIGAKVQFGPTGGGWDIASIVSASLPTGDHEFTSDKVDPALIVAAGRDLGERWSLGSQLMAEWPTEDDDRGFQWGGTVVFGTTLRSRWGTFFELAATVPERGTAPLLVHHGYTYRLGNDIQADFHGGVGLNDTAPDVFIGAGFSYRH